MKLSTKGRYAVVALSDLVLEGGSDYVRLSEIAKRQNISQQYLEQLFVKLRRTGIVESSRGPRGGYRLSRPPEHVNISEILLAVDESIGKPVLGKRTGTMSGSQAQSLANRLWESLSAQVYVHLHNITLLDIVTNGISPCPAVPNLLKIVDE
ncbi:MAG: Rrf2 family transcriptional regulator [Rhodobacteraceae bacterium]|nr:Rrf2 family transcriptional regulator [Paracoccaceae bacterium]